MSFEILVSTIDDRCFKLENKIPFNVLFINQLIKKKKSNFVKDNLFSYAGKGLSKSRNKALEKATGSVCLISDDDVSYKENIDKILLGYYDEFPHADIITFQIETPDGGQFKKYKDKVFWHNERTIMRVSSIEISFKRDSIVEKKITFDEEFGLGAKFATGEEVIFLHDALKKGLKILYVPVPIVIHPKESSGGNFKDNPSLIKAKGAMFYRMFGWKSFFISLLFSFKKYRLSGYSLIKFYSFMAEGKKEYKSVE